MNRVIVDGERASRYLSAEALAGVDAAEAGRRLAELLGVLADPETADEQADNEMRRAALAHWRTIRTVWLGGGIAARFGAPMAERANALCDAYSVRLAPNAAVLPMVGLASDAGVDEGDLVLDFGHTLVKAGLVDRGAPGGLRLLDPTPVPDIRPSQGREFVIEELSRHLWDAPHVQRAHVAIAAYIVDGATRAIYSIYMDLGEDAAATLSEEVSGKCGRRIGVRLDHDGTAAARAVPTDSTGAVITMGTTLGLAFTPPRTRSVRLGQ